MAVTVENKLFLPLEEAKPSPLPAVQFIKVARTLFQSNLSKQCDVLHSAWVLFGEMRNSSLPDQSLRKSYLLLILGNLLVEGRNDIIPMVALNSLKMPMMLTEVMGPTPKQALV